MVESIQMHGWIVESSWIDPDFCYMIEWLNRSRAWLNGWIDTDAGIASGLVAQLTIHTGWPHLSVCKFVCFRHYRNVKCSHTFYIFEYLRLLKCVSFARHSHAHNRFCCAICFTGFRKKQSPQSRATTSTFNLPTLQVAESFIGHCPRCSQINMR